MDVLEIVVQSVGANPIQLFKNTIPQTPVFSMVASLAYIDPAMVLKPWDSLTLITGAALQVVGYVHWRLRLAT